MHLPDRGEYRAPAACEDARVGASTQPQLSSGALHAIGPEGLASGQSDVRSDYCVHITYDVAAGRFTRVSESSAEGDCKSGD